jgi:hypothetical protein
MVPELQLIAREGLTAAYEDLGRLLAEVQMERLPPDVHKPKPQPKMTIEQMLALDLKL